MRLKKTSTVAWIMCFVLVVTIGCVEPPAKTERTFLCVDFQPGRTLRYNFDSERKIVTDWAPDKNDAKAKKESTESVRVVVAYEPMEVNPYGLTKVKATFESVKAAKTGTSGNVKDAVETLAGKSYTFIVGPDGKIHDKSELVELLKEASKAAFGTGRNASVKQPDLLDDVLTTQWYLWDSVASIEKPTKGIKVGQTWKSHLLIPTSMVLRKGRDVTYQLAEVRQTERRPVAVINSTYALSEAKPNAPLPYSQGGFRLAGTFGFFHAMFKGLSVVSLEGTGQELFDINAGRVDWCQQQYTATLKPNASPLPGANPVIYINQKITMQLIEQ